MNIALRRQAKADEYRGLARAAAAAAAATTLTHVRENHNRAELRWTELALAEDERVAKARLAVREPEA